MKTEELQDRIDDAVEIALDCGQFDGAHHKMWVIDQMLQLLLADKYQETMDAYCAPDEGADEDDGYVWDQGIEP